ncbi:MAG: DUF3106 domain-containing protein [Candidatus Binatia bacterium]
MKFLTTRTTLVLFSVILFGPLSAPGHARDLSTVLQETINQGWRDLSPQERSRALENYQRFQKLPPERQRFMEERYDRWRQLPSEERDRLRRNYKRYRDMDSDEKEEFDRKYKKWRSRRQR